MASGISEWGGRLTIRMAHRRAVTNPYTKLFADAIEAASGTPVVDFHLREAPAVRRGDVVHLHWFSSQFHAATKAGTVARSLGLDAYFRFLRARGVLLFWTVNNLISHDAAFPELEYSIIRRLARRFDGLFTFGDETAARLIKEFGIPAERVTTIPHVSYRTYYPRGSLAPIRERYGFDDRPIHLFFGLLRPYKGLENLIAAFNDGERNLLIVGGGAPDYVRELAALNRSPRTRIDPRRVPDEEIPGLFESTDRVILPFDRITMSGSMVLAMSYGCFTVTIADGDVPSYIRDGANGYLMPDNAPETIRRTLERTDLLPEAERRDWAAHVREMTDRDSIGRRAFAAYEAAAKRRGI